MEYAMDFKKMTLIADSNVDQQFLDTLDLDLASCTVGVLRTRLLERGYDLEGVVLVNKDGSEVIAMWDDDEQPS